MDELPRWLFLRGQASPPPERIPLRAGPLTLIFDNGDIRYVRYGEAEVLRRVYVAVRDANWRTVPFTIVEQHVEPSERSFHVRYLGRFRQGDVDVAGLIQITGDQDGTIRFTFEGMARSSFKRN